MIPKNLDVLVEDVRCLQNATRPLQFEPAVVRLMHVAHCLRVDGQVTPRAYVPVERFLAYGRACVEAEWIDRLEAYARDTGLTDAALPEAPPGLEAELLPALYLRDHPASWAVEWRARLARGAERADASLDPHTRRRVRRQVELALEALVADAPPVDRPPRVYGIGGVPLVRARVGSTAISFAPAVAWRGMGGDSGLVVARDGRLVAVGVGRLGLHLRDRIRHAPLRAQAQAALRALVAGWDLPERRPLYLQLNADERSGLYLRGDGQREPLLHQPEGIRQIDWLSPVVLWAGTVLPTT